MCVCVSASATVSRPPPSPRIVRGTPPASPIPGPSGSPSYSPTLSPLVPTPCPLITPITPPSHSPIVAAGASPSHAPSSSPLPVSSSSPAATTNPPILIQPRPNYLVSPPRREVRPIAHVLPIQMRTQVRVQATLFLRGQVMPEAVHLTYPDGTPRHMKASE